MTPLAGFYGIAERSPIGSGRGCRDLGVSLKAPGGPVRSVTRQQGAALERNHPTCALGDREGGLDLGAAPRDLNVFERV